MISNLTIPAPVVKREHCIPTLISYNMAPMPNGKSYIVAMPAILTLALWACSSAPPAREEIRATREIRPADRFYQQIDSILDDSALSACIIGVEVRSLGGGTTLYQRNSGKLFHPASNMKLLTTSTALELLGPDYAFRTLIRSDSSIRDGVLQGDLRIQGSGDPLLKTSDLDSLARGVLQRGISTISGDIVGDVSAFDTLSWGAGWMWDDEPDADEAFISPLTVNDNSVEVIVSPGRRSGDPALVTLSPECRYISVINSGITTFDTLVPHLHVTRDRGSNRIRVVGRIAPHSPGEHFFLSVWKPELYFLTLFRESLQKEGVKVRGVLRTDTASRGMLLAELTHPLDSVLHQVNKPSDNLAAENLLKTIALEKSGRPGSASKGLTAMKEYFATIGIDTSAMVLSDGSGVSFYNQVSPDAIVRLLAKMHGDSVRFKTFYESLPVGGVDGTLKNRFRWTQAERNVRAKTGSLTGASSLSGYVTSADGKLIAFSILCNHFPSQVSILRDVQDRIVEFLARSTTGGK